MRGIVFLGRAPPTHCVAYSRPETVDPAPGEETHPTQESALGFCLGRVLDPTKTSPNFGSCFVSQPMGASFAIVKEVQATRPWRHVSLASPAVQIWGQKTSPKATLANKKNGKATWRGSQEH